MKLVVDTNILFTFFWKDAVAMQLFIFQDLELYAPAFALEEIEKYNLEIKKRANISDKGFKKLRKNCNFL